MISNKELDQMYSWLQKREYEKWYTVASDKAREALKTLLQEYDFSEFLFSDDYSQIKRIDVAAVFAGFTGRKSYIECVERHCKEYLEKLKVKTEFYERYKTIYK
jgi:(p)ppGpp synthase/HD superfamily hydrolase